MMKTSISLTLARLVCIFCVFSFSVSAQQVELEPVVEKASVQQDSFDWATLEKVWTDDIQFHGFFSQGLFHSTGNNVYGKSKNNVSAGLTELGLNMSYQALSNLSFAAQGLYRRAGESTGGGGDLTLDFAFVDITLLNFADGRFGVRGGRVKNPWGLYNETRDVAFTHPTIFLPLIYFERSRGMLLSMDGGQVYADYNTAIGDFSFKFNYGFIHDYNNELLIAITADPNVTGNLESDPSFMTQLSYEISGGKYIFSISYADLCLSYEGRGNFDPYTGLQVRIYPLMLSAQYNGEKFSLTGEYSVQWNEFTGMEIIPDMFPVSEHWYVQAGYRILDNLELNVRYDSSVQDINDRKGQNMHLLTGRPAHLGFTQDWVIGLRWDITPSWMVRTEYHHVHGASMLSTADNPDLANVALDWNIYALQVAFRF